MSCPHPGVDEELATHASLADNVAVQDARHLGPGNSAGPVADGILRRTDQFKGAAGSLESSRQADCEGVAFLAAVVVDGPATAELHIVPDVGGSSRRRLVRQLHASRNDWIDHVSMCRLHTLYQSEQDHRHHEQQRTETPSAPPIPFLFHNSFPHVLDHATVQSLRSFYFQSISAYAGLA